MNKSSVTPHLEQCFNELKKVNEKVVALADVGLIHHEEQSFSVDQETFDEIALDMILKSIQTQLLSDKNKLRSLYKVTSLEDDVVLVDGNGSSGDYEECSNIKMSIVIPKAVTGFDFKPVTEDILELHRKFQSLEYEIDNQSGSSDLILNFLDEMCPQEFGTHIPDKEKSFAYFNKLSVNRNNKKDSTGAVEVTFDISLSCFSDVVDPA
jgi:hypothetical protein